MCWATNSIGRQDRPCVFHLIPAGKPDPVTNCTVRNQTYSTLFVGCKKGFDGGLPQGFMLEVLDAQTHFQVANTTNTRSPAFTVTGLNPGNGYIIAVHSYNAKGESAPVRVHAYTKVATAGVDEGVPKTGESALTRGLGESGKKIMITPILAALVTVAAALALVFLFVTSYFCVTRRSRKRSPNSGGGKVVVTRPRESSHMPLQNGVDDCVTTSLVTKTPQSDGCDDVTTSLMVGRVSKEDLNNPDLIPIQARGKGRATTTVYLS